MRTSAFAALSFALFCAQTPAFALPTEDFETETVVATDNDSTALASLADETAAQVAMTNSDEEAAALVGQQADETDRTADEAARTGAITTDQAQDIHSAMANAREGAKQKGFRKKFLGLLKKIGKGAVEGVGLTGEAIDVGFFGTPIFAGLGFAHGLGTGQTDLDALPRRKAGQVAVVIGDIGGVFGTETGAFFAFGASDAVAAVAAPAILISAAPLFVNHGYCQSNNGKYCGRVAKVDTALTTGATMHGTLKAGAAVHRFFVRIFKHKKA